MKPEDIKTGQQALRTIANTIGHVMQRRAMKALSAAVNKATMIRPRPKKKTAQETAQETAQK